MGRVRQHDPRGVARMLRARCGGGEERCHCPMLLPEFSSINLEIVHRRSSPGRPPDALLEPCPRRAHLIEIRTPSPGGPTSTKRRNRRNPDGPSRKRRNRRNPDGRARGPAKPRAARRDRGGFPRFLDGSTALGPVSAVDAARRRVGVVVALPAPSSNGFRGPPRRATTRGATGDARSPSAGPQTLRSATSRVRQPKAASAAAAAGP